MAELELMGLHPDGEHLVLVGPDGQRHRLPIDDALRAAVRHDRPRLEQVRTTGELRPREIQSRLRAGESPGDIALEAGVAVENVRRYEGPVLAEQAWVAQQARSMTVGRDAGAPALGDLVVDRLARRGVEPDDLDWTAVRRPGEEWELVLHFRAGERDRVARWHVDLADRALHALDDESRWLSETDLGGPAADGRRHLASVQSHDDDARSRVYDIELDALTAGVSAVEVGAGAAAAEEAEEPTGAGPALDSSTAEILEGLRASRGIRQGVVRIDDEAADDGSADGEDAVTGDDPPAAHPAGRSHRRLDPSVLPLRAVPPTPVGRIGGERLSEPDEKRAPRPSEQPVPRRTKQAPPPTAQGGGQQSQVAPPAPEPDESGNDADTSSGGRRRPKSRSRRTSVPSWDEIVFGAKPE